MFGVWWSFAISLSISECFVPNIRLLLKSCWFHCVDVYYIKFRFCETYKVVISVTRISLELLRSLSAKLTKWPNTLKQFVGNLATNCLSVFGRFMGLALKGLRSLRADLSYACTCIFRLVLIQMMSHFNDESFYWSMQLELKKFSITL